MRTSLTAAGLVLLLTVLALPAAAQEELYRAEVGLLFERLEARKHGEFGNFGMDGFNAVLAIYGTRWLAFKADVGGTWGRPKGVLASLYGYHFGAQVARRTDSPWTPWAHALVGRKRIKFDVDTPEAFSVIDQSVSYIFGGGVDYQFHSHWTLRLAEVSYLQTRFGDTPQHNVRLKAGFVFRWGQ